MGVCRRSEEASSISRIKCVYFERENVFTEVEDFIKETEAAFGLNVVRLRCSFQEGCKYMVETHNTKAFLLGTRKSDPYGKYVEFFSPSTPGWPPFMRIHPVLLWGFEDVWRFLRSNALSYCPLYDRGYTSLGETHNTCPNPLLLQPDGTYLPAHTLHLGQTDQHLERKSRVEQPPVPRPGVEEPPTPTTTSPASAAPSAPTPEVPPDKAGGCREGGVEKGADSTRAVRGPRSLVKALKSEEEERSRGVEVREGGAGKEEREGDVDAEEEVDFVTVGLVTIGTEVLSAKVRFYMGILSFLYFL
jgi:3'-phosphoadenosine 5'-phosphosulfate sulfotransferase (PAPS reductase)/FAD synthetase